MDVPTREQIYSLDDCAERPLAIPQWTGAAGERRGVYIRALTFRARMEAERRATQGGAVNPWLLVAYEVAAAITRPSGLTPDSILTWNADVIEFIHSHVLALGGLSGALVASELARLAGEAPPPEPGRVAGGPDAPADDVGGDAGGAAGADPA